MRGQECPRSYIGFFGCLRVSPQTLAKRGVLLVFFNQFITGLGPVFAEEGD